MIELLLVCAIIGTIGAVATANFRNATQQANLREASAQLTADFQRARSSAQRANQTATLAFAATNTALTSYTLTISGRDLSRQLPVGVQVTVPTDAAKTVTYNAPFGETTLVSTAIYTLTSQKDPTLKRYLKIVGLTGKAYLQ